eukprot:gene22843-biopygen20777
MVGRTGGTVHTCCTTAGGGLGDPTKNTRQSTILNNVESFGWKGWLGTKVAFLSTSASRGGDAIYLLLGGEGGEAARAHGRTHPKMVTCGTCGPCERRRGREGCQGPTPAPLTPKEEIPYRPRHARTSSPPLCPMGHRPLARVWRGRWTGCLFSFSYTDVARVRPAASGGPPGAGGRCGGSRCAWPSAKKDCEGCKFGHPFGAGPPPPPTSIPPQTSLRSRGAGTPARQASSRTQDRGAGVARAWRGRGADYRPFFCLGWRGRGAGMSCDPGRARRACSDWTGIHRQRQGETATDTHCLVLGICILDHISCWPARV